MNDEGALPDTALESQPSADMRLPAALVVHALELSPSSVAGSPPSTFSAIATHHEKVQPGALFIASEYPGYSGGNAVSEALARGATGVVIRRDRTPVVPLGIPIYRVNDTLAAFRQIASAWRNEFHIPVIAVVGSVGKTTTSELLASLLRGRFRYVLGTTQNLNGFVGLPLTLARLRRYHQIAVVEIGIDEPGAMIQHMDLVRPTAAVLTAIGPEHLEKLQDLNIVEREECVALTYTSEHGGLLVINLDDPRLRRYWECQVVRNAVGFSLLDACYEEQRKQRDVITGFRENADELVVEGLGLSGLRIRCPIPGAHNARNLVAAIAAARALGLECEEITAGLRTFVQPTGRSEVRRLPVGAVVLCDYFNANPTSMLAALRLLSEWSPTSRRWACLGDMLELGDNEEVYHRALAPPIANGFVDHVLLIGTRMRWLADELAQSDFTGTVEHFKAHKDIAARLQRGLSSGDRVLLKGSRGMRMERVWEALVSVGPSKAA